MYGRQAHPCLVQDPFHMLDVELIQVKPPFRKAGPTSRPTLLTSTLSWASSKYIRACGSGTCFGRYLARHGHRPTTDGDAKRRACLGKKKKTFHCMLYCIRSRQAGKRGYFCWEEMMQSRLSPGLINDAYPSFLGEPHSRDHAMHACFDTISVRRTRALYLPSTSPYV